MPSFHFLNREHILPFQLKTLETMPKTEENLAIIQKMKPAFEKYRGIGIRIEDSFFLTDKGLEHLSAKVPSTVAEIEAFLASRR